MYSKWCNSFNFLWQIQSTIENCIPNSITHLTLASNFDQNIKNIIEPARSKQINLTISKDYEYLDEINNMFASITTY